MFRSVTASVDFPKLEHKILRFWAEKKTFEKRIELNKGKKRWSFMDGPITANNPMGVHHAWGRTYKDLFQRFKSMQGYELRYQNGFDCQGLWIEVEVERQLGFKSKRDIESYGIAEFVKKCKERALHFAAIQVEQSIRLGYWMEWDDPETLRNLAESLAKDTKEIAIKSKKGKLFVDTPERIAGSLGSSDIGGSYFTFSDENNYTIWTALKKCHENGWIYRGRDVMPWCPRCSTSLSQHEIVTEGYRELTHPSVTLRFPLKDRSKEALLVWTTTGWTLTSNVAAAVNPEMTYVKIKQEDEFFYIAKSALERTLSKGSYDILEELSGREMEGWKYFGPFDELEAAIQSKTTEAHKVILWDEVSEEEGTGIVHIAPGCGKEDLELGKIYGLPEVAPLNEYGIFMDDFGKFTGVHVYDSAPLVIDELSEKGLLFKVEDYVHRYPVCWRCESELVFRLVDEWFISMGQKIDKPLEEVTPEEKKTNLRYQIMESANHTRWIPDFGLQQELDWLRNMEDWMISKKRYWGLALPIWICTKCGHFDVIGNKEELKAKATEGWEIFEGHSPHRPWIDSVRIKCARCGSSASRIDDVGNPWLDAGIVSFSTLNYRQNREYWAKWFPADMICESLPGQFRNWFYAMLAMSTIMEARSPFRICFGHGIVLAEDGREMHKSWGNAIWLDDAVEKIGADVMRWMYCTNKPETNLLFGYKRADEIKKRFLIPLWNIYSFFVTYANLDNWGPSSSTNTGEISELDRWILAKLHSLIKDTTQHLENFEPHLAATSIGMFVEELSTWYIRRSRRRFWKSEKDEDKDTAYRTLYTCLTTLTILLAPFIPFTSEEFYQNLVGGVRTDAKESVHHNDWPTANEKLLDRDLLENMELIIKICSLGRAARSKSGIKLRQPLSEAIVVADKKILKISQNLKNIIKEELNVKDLKFYEDMNRLTSYIVKPLPEVLGKKYGRLFAKIQKVIEEMDAQDLVSSLEKNQAAEIEIDSEKILLLHEEVKISREPKEGISLSEGDNIIVGVNTVTPKELRNEGIARDIVRRIQNQRKEANFNISDKIRVYYTAGPLLSEVFEDFGNYIAAETLSTTVCMGEPPSKANIATYKIAGEELKIGLLISEEV